MALWSLTIFGMRINGRLEVALIWEKAILAISTNSIGSLPSFYHDFTNTERECGFYAWPIFGGFRHRIVSH